MAVPTAPGTSVQLHYPVLLVGEHGLVVKDDEKSLTTTTVASGLNFPEFTLFDSSGAKYTILKVTDFGRKSVLLDMGTSHFRVFLEMKRSNKNSLADAKALVKQVALGSGTIAGSQAASNAIDRAGSFPEFIEVCRKAWEWR